MSRTPRLPRRLSFDELEPRVTLSTLPGPDGNCTTGPADVGQFIRPTTGPLTSAFGSRNIQSQVPGSTTFHQGVDVGAKKGAPIQAVLAGKVVYAGANPDRPKNGIYVAIEHGKDANGRPIRTFYLHTSEVAAGIAPGMCVSRGEVIAKVGNTSSLTIKPHLHFQVYRGDEAINPGLTGAFKSASDVKKLLELESKQVEAFNGSYVGGYSGTATVKIFGRTIRQSVSGSVRFYVSNRNIAVSVPGGGRGTIAASGKAQFGTAEGSVLVQGANCKFTGTFRLLESRGAVAGGGWSCTFTISGVRGTASGQWNASR